MLEMNGTTVINRPVDDVFAYVMEVSNDANWRTGVDESGWQSGEPIAPGAIGYTLAGKTRAERRVTSYIPCRSVDWELISGPYKGRLATGSSWPEPYTCRAS